jgi:hypothetical protein
LYQQGKGGKGGNGGKGGKGGDSDSGSSSGKGGKGGKGGSSSSGKGGKGGSSSSGKGGSSSSGKGGSSSSGKGGKGGSSSSGKGGDNGGNDDYTSRYVDEVFAHGYSALMVTMSDHVIRVRRFFCLSSHPTISSSFCSNCGSFDCPPGSHVGDHVTCLDSIDDCTYF